MSFLNPEDHPIKLESAGNLELISPILCRSLEA